MGSNRIGIKLSLILALVSTLLFCLKTDTARAEDAETTTVVMIADGEDEDTARQVIRAVEAQLSDLPVVFHVSWVATQRGQLAEQLANARREADRLNARAVFWLGAGDAPALFLSIDDETDDVLRRSLEDSTAFAENLALIVRGVVQLLDVEPDSRAALLESPAWTTTQPPPPQPQPPQAEPERNEPGDSAETTTDVAAESRAPAEPERRRRLSIHLGYQVDFWSTNIIAQHTIALSLQVRLYRELRLILGTQVVFPATLSSPDVELQLRRHPIHLGLRYDHDLGRISLGGSLGFVIDIIGEEVDLSPDFVEAGDGTEVEVGLQALFHIDIELITWLSLELGLGATLPFNRVDYAYDRQSDQVELLSSFALRPIVLLGLVARVF